MMRLAYLITYFLVLHICIFFFQAEDGIRDLTVTGVQTCALPIYDRCLRELVLEPAQVLEGELRGRERDRLGGDPAREVRVPQPHGDGLRLPLADETSVALDVDRAAFLVKAAPDEDEAVAGTHRGLGPRLLAEELGPDLG